MVLSDALTYADLKRGGEAVARGLMAADLVPGESVALMLPTGRDYFEAFLGILLAGGVPVPIYPPGRPSQIEEHLRRHAQILSNARATMLLTVPEGRGVARLLRSSVETMRHVTTPTDLARSGGHGTMPRARPDHTALIQYTSGSTGDPKGVVLSHANVLANIRAMGQAAEVTPRDVFVSWLPLYHDMGLIGAWLGSMCLGMPVVIMSPLAFLARPARWLAAIDAYRGTITAAPNFAYELCLRKVIDTELQTLDLSTLRMALNGAEPVVAHTMERFAQRFARCGLRPEALAPVYGLAEAAVGLAFPPPGRGLLIDAVDAERLRRDGQAVPALPEGLDALRIVASGQPLPGYEIRVVEDSGREQPDRTEGQIEFRGPSATAGYQRNSKATAALIPQRVAQDRRPRLCGRRGCVHHRPVEGPHHPGRTKLAPGGSRDVRWAAARRPQGLCGTFATEDAETATERLIVVAETTETAGTVREDASRTNRGHHCRSARNSARRSGIGPQGNRPQDFEWQDSACGMRRSLKKGAIGVHQRSVMVAGGPLQLARCSAWIPTAPSQTVRPRVCRVRLASVRGNWATHTRPCGDRAGTNPAPPCGPICYQRPSQALGNPTAHSRCHPCADRHHLRGRRESCQLARLPRHGCIACHPDIHSSLARSWAANMSPGSCCGGSAPSSSSGTTQAKASPTLPVSAIWPRRTRWCSSPRVAWPERPGCARSTSGRLSQPQKPIARSSRWLSVVRDRCCAPGISSFVAVGDRRHRGPDSSGRVRLVGCHATRARGSRLYPS